ncbi:MAG: hypothetical protein V4624_08755 [Pseudomonadota bacterium]
MTRFQTTRLAFYAAILVTLSSCGSGSSSSTRASSPSTDPDTARILNFEPIYHDVIALPAGVMPWAPTWSPDGKHILFTDYNDNRGNEWLVEVKAGNAYGTPTCLTCDMTDRPTLVGVFSYVFPDNKRMFIANELGDLAYVLECAPSLFDCTTHKYLPIDLSADTALTSPGLGRRTFHLAPDGVHLAYSMVRLDALVMLVSRLQKTATGYAAVGHKVINPPGPTGPTDMSADNWANAGQLYEFKSFADGGASALIVGEPTDGNADMLKVDLASGKTTRLTTHPDWDEDGSFAPDNSSLLVASWRGMNRLDAFSIMPLARPFTQYPVAAAVAIYYVSSHQGFACDLQPWLISGKGDLGGKTMGQPVAPYRGGNNISGNNLAALSFWSPDSTRILVQERQLSDIPAAANTYVKQKGTAPNRLLIARLDRAPTTPAAVVSSEPGAWAKTPSAFMGAYALPGVVLVNGNKGGTALITYVGNVAAGNFTVLYDRFTDDGENFLDGFSMVTGSVARAGLLYNVDLTSSDAEEKQTGFLKANLIFANKLPAPATGEPPSTKSGTISASYKGQTADSLPDVAACPESFPRPSALNVSSRRQGSTLRVRVTADIFGDIRPVTKAVITVGSKTQKTDANGEVLLTGIASGSSITATAGDTFLPAAVLAP